MKKIENTAWAKRFWTITGGLDYETGIKLAIDPALRVRIEKNTDLGYKQWAIVVIEPNLKPEITEFWLESFDTKKEAVALCKEMRWKIQK